MVYNFDTRFFVKPGEIIARLLAKTRITPNQITVVRFLTTIPLSTYLFTKNQHLTNIIAVIILYISCLFDNVDGILARMKNLKSEIGAWLDEFEDKVTQVVVLMGIIWGVFVTSDRDLKWLFVGLILILGTNIQSFIGAQFKERYNLYYDTVPHFRNFFREKKLSKWDSFLKDLLAPENFFSTLIATYSYFIVLGAFLNIMKWMVLVMAILGFFHGLAMCYVFSRAIMEKGKASLLVQGLRKLKEIT